MVLIIHVEIGFVPLFTRRMVLPDDIRDNRVVFVTRAGYDGLACGKLYRDGTWHLLADVGIDVGHGGEISDSRVEVALLVSVTAPDLP
jgi:hypothetical protein